MAAELHRDDGRRGAHGKVEELDGVGSHHVGDAMMVDDLDDLGLLDAVGGLARLVVVHEHHLALRAHGHVRARDDADGKAVVVQHDGLAQRAGHEVFDSLLEQALLVEDEHIGLGDLVHLLTERGDEVAGDRHLVRPSVLEGVGGGDVALGDHARGDVVVRHHERAHVVLAQQATRLEQRGVMADGYRVRRHHVSDARMHMTHDLGRGDTALFQNPGALRRQRPQAGGNVRLERLPLAGRTARQLVLQVGVAHCRGDGIVVRVLVAHDDDRCRHCCTPYPGMPHARRIPLA